MTIIYFLRFLKIFINNSIFCNILVWKYHSFKFIVKNLDVNFLLIKYKRLYFFKIIFFKIIIFRK